MGLGLPENVPAVAQKNTVDQQTKRHRNNYMMLFIQTSFQEYLVSSKSRAFLSLFEPRGKESRAHQAAKALFGEGGGEKKRRKKEKLI